MALNGIPISEDQCIGDSLQFINSSFQEVDSRTTVLSSQFEALSSTTNNFVKKTGDTITGPTIISTNTSSDALRITQTGSGNALTVEDNTNPDTTRFIVTSAGNVGIGVAGINADEKLRIDGLYSSNQNFGVKFSVPGNQWSGGIKLKSNSTGSPRIAIETPLDTSGNELEAISIRSIDGNVGIGVENPSSSKLMVAGSLSASGNINSGRFMFAPGNSVGGDGGFNTAFGNALTQISNIGDHNTAMGRAAMFNIVDGSYNTAVGAGALWSAYGTNTGAGNSRAGNSIFGAYSCFGVLSSGDGNSCSNNAVVGSFSLNTIGGSSVDALSATRNTLMGNNVFSNCGDAKDGYGYFGNVAIGDFAGNSLTQGAFNTIHIGYNVLGSATGNTNICRIGNADIQSVQFGAGGAFASTGSAPNVFYSTSTGRMFINTSSLRYKKDIEDVQTDFSENIIYNSRPIWYKSKDEYADKVKEEFPASWSYWGFIAEEMAEIDPRLVTWSYLPEDYEEVIVGYSKPNNEPLKERRLKEGSVKVPNGINYDKFTVHLVKIAQKQKQEIEDLKSQNQDLQNKLNTFETRLKALESI